MLLRVQNGATLLDENCPNWWERIDLEFLDMVHYHTCILGQLFEHFDRGVKFFKLTNSQEAEFGFRMGRWFGEYSDLDECWRVEVRKRLAANRRDSIELCLL